MKTEVINIKTDPGTKQKARQIAHEMGFSLGTIVNAYLKQLIKERAVSFSVNPKEEPSDWLINELKQAEQDRRLGFVSPEFNNFEASTGWLKDPKAKYVNGKYANRIRKPVQKKV
jgi:addiction module RelB/DinJ family antitoxin